MTLVGKIFIVLILVMSVFFMAMAVSVYSTHQNWKNARDQVRTLYNQARDDNQQLESEKEQLKNTLTLDRAARREAIATLEQRHQQMRTQFEEASNRYSTLLETNNTLVKSVELAQQQLEQLKDQVRELRTTIVAAQQDRDEQFAKVRELTDQINQAEGIKQSLEQRLRKLTEQFAKAETVLKAHDLHIDSPVTNIPPSLVGQVLAVNSGQEFVTISLGSHDGIKQGHTVEVSRRDRYLGRARITRVSPDRAVGELLKEYHKAPIQEGDSVQTKVR